MRVNKKTPPLVSEIKICGATIASYWCQSEEFLLQPVVNEDDVISTNLKCHQTRHNLVYLICQHELLLIPLWTVFNTNQLAISLRKVKWGHSKSATSLRTQRVL